MNLLTQHQSVVALTASKAIATSNAAAAQAKAAVAAAVAKRDALAKRQADLKREVAKYKALLATLTAAERAKYYNPVPQPSAATVAQVMVRAVATADRRHGARLGRRRRGHLRGPRPARQALRSAAAAARAPSTARG